MALFTRQTQPPTYSTSRQYKSFLRIDFKMCCAYCERPEAYLGGIEAFEVEHFRPKSKFPELECIYTNLYYACRGCNGHKSETWPSDELMARGMTFADPCEADPYIHHLLEEADGGVTGTTACGVYTAAHIRLGREDLRRWRTGRAQAIKDIPIFTRMMDAFEQLRLVTPNADQSEVEARIGAITRYIDDVRGRFGIS